MQHSSFAIVVLTAVSAIPLAGCSVGPYGTPLLSMRSAADSDSEYRLTKNVGSADVMRSVLLRQIPIGATQDHARRQLQIEGFEPTFRRKADFADKFDKYEDVDFLYGDRSDSTGLLTSKRWQVAVIIEDGRVAKLAVSEGSIGL